MLRNRKKIQSRKAQIEVTHKERDSNPASTVSPHYKFSDLNASIHNLAEGFTPTTRTKKERKMKKKDNRERVLQIRLSQEEFDAIERKFKNSGMKSKSEFVRAIIFEGHLVYFNENELREIHRLMNNASFNINQIARRVNSTNNVYKSDLDKIKEMLNNIWQPLIYFQSQLLRLKR